MQQNQTENIDEELSFQFSNIDYCKRWWIFLWVYDGIFTLKDNGNYEVEDALLLAAEPPDR